jgi:predicted lipoprotein with Yx(FWY)xxD motif
MNASLTQGTRPHVDSSRNALRAPSLFTVAAAIGIAACVAFNVAHGQQVAEKNGMLTDAAGKTLYTFDKDAAGRSNCNGGCAVAWPPFYAGDAAKDNAPFGIVSRDDGRRQWARDGKPLYFFAGDVQAGDTRGEGSGGVWHVVKPAAQRVSAPSSSAYGYGYATSEYGYANKP